MISQLWKAALLSLIILSGTMAQHSRGFDQFRSRLNRRAVPIVPGNTNSRSDVVWGGEDGWNLSELELLTYFTDIHYVIYSEEEYFQAEAGTETVYDFYNMYLPKGWFRALEGKTVVVTNWEPTNYMDDGTPVDGGEFSVRDSLIFRKGVIENNYNLRGSTGQMFLYYNDADQLDSMVLTGSASYHFDRIIFQYEDNQIVSHSIVKSGNVRFLHSLEYESGSLVSSYESWFDSLQSEYDEKKYSYDFYEGKCFHIRDSIKDSLGNWIEVNDWQLNYDDNGDMSEAIIYIENSNDEVIGYGGGSSKFTYTVNGLLETKEQYHTGVMSRDSMVILPWEPYDKDSIVYNSNGDITEEFDFNRNSNTKEWEISGEPDVYTYNEKNNLIEYPGYAFVNLESVKTAHVVTYREGYPDSIVQTDPNDSIRSIMTYKFYDNPASIDPVSVQKDIAFSVAENVVTLNHVSKVSPLKLYTVSGKEVAEIAPEQFGSSVKFNLKQSNIAQGVYIGKITADGSALEQKLVIR